MRCGGFGARSHRGPKTGTRTRNGDAARAPHGWIAHRDSRASAARRAGRSPAPSATRGPGRKPQSRRPEGPQPTLRHPSRVQARARAPSPGVSRRAGSLRPFGPPEDLPLASGSDRSLVSRHARAQPNRSALSIAWPAAGRHPSRPVGSAGFAAGAGRPARGSAWWPRRTRAGRGSGSIGGLIRRPALFRRPLRLRRPSPAGPPRPDRPADCRDCRHQGERPSAVRGDRGSGPGDPGPTRPRPSARRGATAAGPARTACPSAAGPSRPPGRGRERACRGRPG